MSKRRRIGQKAGQGSFEMLEPERGQAPITSHLYLNLSIINSDVSDSASNRPQQAVFSEVRSTPIIQNAADYEMSVVRFSANGVGRLLPLYIPVVKSNSITETIYSVTVVQPSGTLQVYLEWSPEFLDSPIPTQPNDITGGTYYYGRTYSHFCNLFNDAFWKAYNGVNSVPNSANPLYTVLTYSPTTSLFSLNFPSSLFYNAPTAAPSDYTNIPPVSFVYFNNPLGLLLANFNMQTQPFPITQGKEYLIITPPFGTLNSVARVGVGYGAFSQDFPSVGDMWSPIDTYVFQTTFLPVTVEQGTAPIVIGQDNTGQGQGVTAGFSSVLTDFVPGVSAGAEDAITSIVYTPTGEYRMASSASTGPVSRVDVQLSWKYRLTGQLVPVFLSNMASLSMKIMFRERGYHGGA